MVISNAKTVTAYLAALAPEVRAAISRVREVILSNLPDGYEETINWGMICYEVPLTRYPDTYNKQPLCYVAVAAQKHYRSLYMTGCYMSKAHDNRLRRAFREAGLKLDMGKSCIRFKTADDLPLKAIGEMVAAMPVEELIRQYEKVRGSR